MYKGQLEGFPTEVVEKMLYYQAKQKNKQDIAVFEDYNLSSKDAGGFDWNNTSEKQDFWRSVINGKCFNLFFERYPKQPTANQMNVKQIIKDNNIREVYSAYHGIYVDCLFAINNFNDDGSLEEGGECLIFPSKEERNWDRFKPKEPTYKPCKSVEQFADLFLGAKVKHKKDNTYSIVSCAKSSTLKYWFDNYTLIDGTPLGIKCENE